MRLAAVITAVSACLLLLPESGWVAAHRLGQPVRAVGARSVLAAGTIATGCLVFLLPVPLLVLTIAALALGVGLARQIRADVARRARLAAVQDSAELTDLLACQLRAGLLPSRALAAAAVDHPVVEVASAVAASAGNVPAALRTAADAPGRQVLVDVAGAWQVADRVGAPLADALERVAAATRERAELQRDVAANVAPARTTARIMAVLPVFGLLLGSGLGARPLMVVTTSVVGALCVAGGAVLAVLGLAWIDAIATAAEE